jgi:AraC-like DNA-binding protein
MVAPAIDGGGSTRSRVLTSPLALVEHVACTALGPPGVMRYPGEFQVAFPYRGTVRLHVGGDEVAGDPNQVMYVTAGEAYRASTGSSGYAELVVTPSAPVLSELAGPWAFSPGHHPLFRARCRRATPALQRMVVRLLHGADDGDDDDEGELVLDLLRAALEIDRVPVEPSRRTRRLITRTRELLYATFARPLRLADIARAVGASPTYLTDVFRRFEGISLKRYVTQLRLARALVELPGADDLTALALELGFSSHSHFTLAFRRTYGCTPSAFRAGVRGGAASRRPG